MRKVRTSSRAGLDSQVAKKTVNTVPAKMMITVSKIIFLCMELVVLNSSFTEEILMYIQP
ncbi:hypothetical protein D3C75_1316150 [compost metagenome]